MDRDLSFRQAIQEHLELTRRNAALAETMPLDRYIQQPLSGEHANEQLEADPWQGGLWAAPPSFDWGD